MSRHRKSGLPDLRAHMLRNSGKPEFRCGYRFAEKDMRHVKESGAPSVLPPVRQGSGGMAGPSPIRMMHDRIMRRVAIGSATVFAGAVVLWLSGWL